MDRVDQRRFLNRCYVKSWVFRVIILEYEPREILAYEDLRNL
jgi:hypothetical protein